MCVRSIQDTNGKRTNLELLNGIYSLDVEYFNEPGFTRPERR